MRHISPEELIALHDANISRYGGLPGMSDPGRAEAIIGRVGQSCVRRDYRPFRSLRHLHGGYSEGHIFNDANKRTALNSALLFLRRNGVQVFDSPELADLTVGAATGEDICIFCRRHVT
ncbi:type II toxin-antitoxin system death-on-curing family toxin [Escherichia coli]|uniref:type II toxin-antitoxin system death-on-curing family toxin n=1 Tax=Escherichia coli TaxID=562 RepID=UPI00235A0E98|nr:type II toxin-antitoxin system death-on-curing family toxin [Escherichia coli]MDC9041805.1 type II toxin-antitoxin system death-on-curing family toxin [Escherichia coli]